MKRPEDKEKDERNNQSRAEQTEVLPWTQRIYFHALSLAGMAQPRDDGSNGDGRRHTQVSNHLSIIAGTKGNDALKDGEGHGEDLPRYISFGNENQRRRADERSRKDEVIIVPRKEKGGNNQSERTEPQRQLEFCKGFQSIDQKFHKDLKNGIPVYIFSDLTM